MEFLSTIYSRPLNITLGIAGWIGIAWLIIVRKRLKMHWLIPIILSSIFVYYSVYAVQLFAMIENGFDWTRRAMSLYGMPFFIPVLLLIAAWITKRNVSTVFDVFSINTVLTCMGGRANCFFAGCCQGRFIPSIGIRVPTREIEMLFYLAFLIIMVPRVYKKKTHGTAFPFYMVGYGILRFFLEFFRDTEFTTLFHLAHFWSLLCVAIGLSWILSAHEAQKKHFTRR